MSTLATLIYELAVASGFVGLLYTSTVTAAALTALATRTPARRRAALDVLNILLRPRHTARGVEVRGKPDR